MSESFYVTDESQVLWTASHAHNNNNIEIRL